MALGIVTDRTVKEITRNLRDSYGTGVTEEMVRAEIAKLQDNQKPDNIIGMFTESMLRGAGWFD